MRIHLIISIFAIVFLLLPVPTVGTEQFPDTVRYHGSVLYWRGQGLAPVLEAREIKFAIPNTACYDGHIASWEIKDNRLFLVGLKAWIRTKGLSGKRKIREVGLEFLFSDSETVFAEWFTGDMFLLESESELNKDWIVEATYWHFTVQSGYVIQSIRVEESFDFHDNKQTKRYVTLFHKLPRR